jgi:hypothetical protein
MKSCFPPSQRDIDEVLHVPVQLAIKALDSAEHLRRQASTAASTKQSFNGGSSDRGISAAEIKKQMEDDAEYGTEVASLAIRVIATCMFHGSQWRDDAQENPTKTSSSYLPSAASLESYMKKLRLDRICNGDTLTDEKIAGAVVYGSKSRSSPISNHFGSLKPAVSGDESILGPERSPPNVAHVSYSSDEWDNAIRHADLDDISIPDCFEATSSTSCPTLRKRQITTTATPGYNECAEAQSPSSPFMLAAANSPSSEESAPYAESIIMPRTIYEAPELSESPSFFEHELLSKGHTDKVYLPCRIKLQPKPNVISKRSVSYPAARAFHPQPEVKARRQRAQLVAEDLADVLLRICWQLEALLRRRPNYYGGVFRMAPLESNLNLLKKRAFTCLEYLSTGRVAVRPSKGGASAAGGRNAPTLDDDHDSDTTLGHGFYSHSFGKTSGFSEPSFPFSPAIRDVVGRVFWQDVCCGGEFHNIGFVTWKQFADAFERAFGPQPHSVMDRFKVALVDMDELSAVPCDNIDAAAISGSASSCLDEDTPPPSPSGFSLTGFRKMYLNGTGSASSSPSRKKRKSHVPKWIRKSMPCHIIDCEQECECCSHENGVNEGGSVALFNDSVGTGKPKMASLLVSMETFSKFCTNHGGLFEGFVAVTDPGTHIECLGSVEDLSKEELFNLGILEENDNDDSSSNEVAESSMLLKPTIVKDLLGLQILQLSCGGQHAAVLLEGGEVFTVSIKALLESLVNPLIFFSRAFSPHPRSVNTVGERWIR